MVNILGISCFYHDSGAAIIRDGKVAAMAEEERFTRIKHDYSYPENAVKFCLDYAKIAEGDLDYVVFYEKPFLKFERILLSTLSTFPKSHKVFRESMITWIKDKLWIKNTLKNKLKVPDDKILFVDHHLSHASASYLPSPFKEAAILTVDGVGEWTTTAYGYAKGNDIKLLKEIKYPHSLGLLYSAFTAFLGFKVNSGEYKVMGLAPYGKPKYKDDVYKLINVKEDGSYTLNLEYFDFYKSTDRTYSKKFINLFGEPRPFDGKDFDSKHADIASSVQCVIEEVLIKIANKIHEETNMDNLCISGGVAYNSVANYKILKETPFKDIYVQPSAGDGGGALGSALYVFNTLLGNERTFIMEDSLYGAEYSDEEIESFLSKNVNEDVTLTKYEDTETLLEAVTTEIVDKKVVGWFQGRFEWGARALGNRSIIANPMSKDMQDTVNLKIKFREGFRPFAPSVISEVANDYFVLPNNGYQYPLRFMLYVVPVVEDKRVMLPAVTHVDGSARPQVVYKESNPLYHRLIEKFGEKTGVPVVLNTSFNLRGEPIVNTPQEAYNTFMSSSMDMLVMGNYVLNK